MYTFMLTTLTAVLTPLTAVLTFTCLKILRTRLKHRHIPSPKSSSLILGHFYDILKETRKGRGDNPIDGLMLKWHAEVGDTFVLYTLWNASVVIFKPADIKVVLSNPSYHKSNARVSGVTHVLGERLFGDAMFSLYDNEKHKKTRQLYNEAFDHDFLQTIFPKFNERTEAFVRRLKSFADGKTEVAMKNETYNFTMKFISQVIYSMDFDTEWRGRSLGMKYQQIDDYGTLWRNAYQALSQSFLDPFFKYLHPKKVEAYREVIRTLRMIGRECITKRITAIEKGEQVPNDILTRIVQLSMKDGTLDIENMVDQFISLHAGGGEPTTSILPFAIAQILLNPDVLQQLMSEIDEVLGMNREIKYEDLAKLKYTEQVILETVRMYAPANPTPRESPPEGVTLSGYFIPPGTPIGTHLGALLYMPQYFDCPETFQPSRFSSQNSRPNPCVFVPFGMGTRACLGASSQFVMIMLKTVIARLFQVYRITLPEGYQLEVGSSLAKYPYNDIPCTIVPRK